MIIHPIPPVYDKNSRILILGSFPSVKSREQTFFYGHKQNRFWSVIANIFDCNIPQTIDEKKSLLLTNRIAVWDTIHSCDIVGSSDSSITNVVPNDLSCILECADIKQIFCNGAKSFNLFNKYISNKIGRRAILLPSTSPANAKYSLDMLIEQWSVIKLGEITTQISDDEKY